MFGSRLVLVFVLTSIAAVGLACRSLHSDAPAPAHPVANERTTVVGIAHNGKGGAVVVVDGSPVYIDGLEAWPGDWQGREVTVTGVVTTRDGLSSEQAARKGGIVGPYRVLERAEWHLRP